MLMRFYVLRDVKMLSISFGFKKKKLLEMLDLWQQKYTSGIAKCREDELYVTGSVCLAQCAVSKKGSCCDILPLELGSPLMQVLPTESAALTDSLSRPCVIHRVIFVKVSTVRLISFRPFGGSAARKTVAWSDAAQSAHLKKWRWRWGRAVGGFCGWQADQSRLDRRTKLRKKLRHNSSDGIPVVVFFPPPYLARRSIVAQLLRANQERSVCHHHVSGNSSNNRCVRDRFSKRGWEPRSEKNHK